MPKEPRPERGHGKAAGSNLTAKLLSAPQIVTTASGLAYSRATKSYTGTVTIKNNGTTTIGGPF